MDFDKAARAASVRFEASVAQARDGARARGARLMPLRVLEACRSGAARVTAAGLPDAELLRVVGSRTALLDLDERAEARVRSPREALRLALANALSDTLSDRMDALLAEGRDAGALGDAVRAALVALGELEAAGIAYPLLDTARDVLDGWGEGASALAMHAGAFLEGHGYPGVAQDLEAAADAHDADPGADPYAGPR